MFLVISDIDTFFNLNEQLNKMSEIIKTEELLKNQTDLEKFKFIIDTREENNNSLLEIFRNNMNYKEKIYKNSVYTYKNELKDSTHYIWFNYKLNFTTGLLYPEPERSKYEEAKNNISEFIYKLYEKEISLKNNSEQDKILHSGIILNSFANIKTDKKYILVQSIEDIKDDGNEYVTLTELTAINRIQESILKKIEERKGV